MEEPPLSILHVALSSGFGGTERYCVDLAGKQQGRGHRVGIVGWRPRKGANSLFEHVPAGVAAFAAPRLFTAGAIARAIEEQSADIINLHLPDPPAARPRCATLAGGDDPASALSQKRIPQARRHDPHRAMAGKGKRFMTARR